MADATCIAGKRTLGGGGAIAFNARGNAMLTHIIPTGAGLSNEVLAVAAENVPINRARYRSSRAFSAARNCAASAPSSARWSHDMQR